MIFHIIHKSLCLARGDQQAQRIIHVGTTEQDFSLCALVSLMLNPEAYQLWKAVYLHFNMSCVIEENVRKHCVTNGHTVLMIVKSVYNVSHGPLYICDGRNSLIITQLPSTHSSRCTFYYNKILNLYPRQCFISRVLPFMQYSILLHLVTFLYMQIWLPAIDKSHLGTGSEFSNSDTAIRESKMNCNITYHKRLVLSAIVKYINRAVMAELKDEEQCRW